MRKKIKIAFTDFPGPLNPRLISELISKNYDLIIDNESPDYVIYSVFGFDFLRYKNAIRIFFVGENIRPDFNICDYAFGYDWMEFGDRYYRCPNYLLYPDMDEILRRRKSDLQLAQKTIGQKKFCNFLYHNGQGCPIRDEFFQLLSEYRFVNSAGNHLRNSTYTTASPYDGDWWIDKVNYQKEFRFTIAFENSSTPGYTTEKLIHALAADTIPIYWGDPLVSKDWNPKRFVNVHEYRNLYEVINYVKLLNEDRNKYLSVLSEPFFKNNHPPQGLNTNYVLEKLAYIFEQNLENAGRRNIYFWGKMYEDRFNRQVMNDKFIESSALSARISRFFRKIYKVLQVSNTIS
jgi:hypothetical protein